MANALIHFPKAVKLLFMLFASANRAPFEFVRFTRSEPARSTTVNRADVLLEVLTRSVKITCDLLDAAFIKVGAITLRFPASLTMCRISFALPT